MKKYFYTLFLKTKLDLKSSEILITYYAVPLVFFLVMGAVFTATMPEYKEILIPAMIIFAVTMGALIGTPGSILEYVNKDIRKTFKSIGIPLRVIILAAIVSGLINLVVVSLIIYFVSPIIYDAVLPANQINFLLGVPLFAITSLLVGILIGLYGENSSKVTMMSQALFLPSMLLSGIMFPAEMLPQPLEYLGKILPATHGFNTLTAPLLEASNYIILIGMIIVSIVLISLKTKKMKHDF